MIDTKVIEIHTLSQNQMNMIKHVGDTKLSYQNIDGLKLYEFCSAQLSGSYDYKIRWSIHDMDHVSTLNNNTGKKNTHFVPAKEYLRLEFSLTKFATTVNLCNLSLINDCINLTVFRKFFYEKTNVMLPDFSEWILERIDVSYNFCVGSQIDAENLLNVFKKLNYPRRQKLIYKNSVYFLGSTNLFKIYGKFGEFRDHDYKRLQKYFVRKDQKLNQLDELHRLANGILRFELEIKKRKLRDFGIVNLLDFFEKFDVEAYMTTEYQKIHQGAKTGKISRSEDVRKKLHSNYQIGQGISPDSVFSIWFSISTGQPLFCDRMKKKRALAVLERLNISCLTSLNEGDVPEEFLSGSVFFPFFQPAHKIHDDKILEKINELIPEVECESNTVHQEYFNRLFPINYDCFNGFDDDNNQNVGSSLLLNAA